MEPLDNPLVTEDKEPVYAFTIHGVETQLNIMEKIKTIDEYMRGLPHSKFAGVHRVEGVIIIIQKLTTEI